MRTARFRRLVCSSRWISSTVGALLALTGAPSAQQQPTPIFRSGVELVTLDVSVLDKERRPVRGLTADDFTVLEDGTSQPVVTFNAIDLPDVPRPAVSWVRDIAPDVVSNERPPRRIVVILMDDAHTALDPWIAESARRTARTVIDQLGEDDLAAVTFTDTGRRQNLTTDRVQLRAAVDSFVSHPDVETNTLLTGYRRDRSAMGGTTSENPPPPCMLSGKSRGIGACVLAALEAVAQALTAAPQGRKTVVYIGSGIPYDFSMSELRGWRNPHEDISDLQSMLRSLQAANINIHALDPCGVQCGIAGPQQDWLRMVSEETGGRAIVATNAPEAAVPQIFIENSSYYLLGFRSSNQTADGGFRKIQVKVNRPGVDVHTRSGYYAPRSDTTRTAGKTTAPPPVDRALSQGVPGGGLSLAMAVTPIAGRNRSEAALAITLSLREPLAQGRQRVELVTTAVDQACPTCTRQAHRQTLELVPPAGAQESPGPHDMLSRLAVKPGRRYNVRVAAALGARTGTVFTDVDVPNFAKDPLAVSGLVLSLAPPVVARPAQLFSDVLPVLPSTIREFRTGMTVTAFLRITQGGANPLAAIRVAASIRNEKDGVDWERTASLDASSFDARRVADYRLQLPIATLAPGPHLLTIELSLGESVVTRDARFTIK